MVAERVSHFKVLWKKNIHAKSPSVRMDYTARDLAHLFDILKTSENVTTQNVEFLYVHLIPPTGNPQEVFVFEEDKGNAAPATRTVNIVNIKDAMLKYGKTKEIRKAESDQKRTLDQVAEILRKEGTPARIVVPTVVGAKPRIRLKTQGVAETPQTGGYFYDAYEAKAK